ncbi:MAG: XRE family transcriptional regulator [Bacteroidales bacterium]|nr:XRE family transcriptional regulator [Bacteroidales bacterium]
MEPIGQLIKNELIAQERSVAWFARKLCLDRSNVYRLFQKNSIDTSLLARISLVLNKDFFAMLSAYVREKCNLQQ